MNASAAVKEMPEREQPTVEKFRIVALQYCDADAAASLMEELKTTTLEKMKSEIIANSTEPIAENRAERMAKSSPEWTQYIRDMCSNRAKATKLKLQLEYFRMLDKKEDREAWAARTEQRMSR
jgi:adenosylmethionine-8-amino-7-oxononanoate aminotransferase